jgi:2-oxo-4-hydroxy-4-carboxy-5-ureidoimidazoline decarboxylase
MAEQVDVAEFDTMAPEAAQRLLWPCCASDRWVSQLVRGRPHGTLERLGQASDQLVAQLEWSEIEQALSAHPRIGERAPGADREARWSRDEQSALQPVHTEQTQTGPSQTDVATALAEGNLAYEQRFGHVFLICATGRSAVQILAALRSRLGNEPVAEHEVVRAELSDIVRLRLAKTFR